MNFQEVVMRLSDYWADRGCLIWQPYNVQVGAGTMNPATVLRVLGPEPWNVAYLEPSVRPADGRYGENPNRWQQFFQYQVILKPDPGNPQELYLGSLEALGIDPGRQDVRFVEDNWASPALGAWGLGWEVWLNGQEISQYTYFQQAGGLDLDPVSVEITYGLERIVMVLQDVRTFLDIRYTDSVTYGELLLRGEVEHCTYNFEVGDVERLRSMYDLCEAEAKSALEHGLVMPAHDYVLKCSHLFNVLDSRGAVGVTERARFFVRMRDLARQVSAAFLAQREEAGFPLAQTLVPASGPEVPPEAPDAPTEDPQTFLLEVGCEELPVGDLDQAITDLREAMIKALKDARLDHKGVRVLGTPRRLVALVDALAPRQRDDESVVRGPAVAIAYDEDGAPTRAAQGFARGRGVPVEALGQRQIDEKDYVVAIVVEEGRPAADVLAEVVPEVLGGLRFQQSMRWNDSRVAFSRPLRWIVALLGDGVIPCAYAGVEAGRHTRGARPDGSPRIIVCAAEAYERQMAEAGIMLDIAEREALILSRAQALAESVGGAIVEDHELLREVANLVEDPLPILGSFADEYLSLPDSVLLAVMHKHQRYLPVVRDGELLPNFVAVANGRALDVDAIRHGNEEVLRARYADADYFYRADTQTPLSDFTPKLDTLTFQEDLGSVLAKVRRLESLVVELADLVGYPEERWQTVARAAALCKSDLATQLVVEFTSLQGRMGRHYALLAGESETVAQAIEEHYLPRSAGDRLPETIEGLLVGLADRLDTLVGLFAVGIQPTGAADPWGLRRAALGAVQLLVSGTTSDGPVSLPLPEALSAAAAGLPLEVDEAVLREVQAFILQRYRVDLLDRGYRYDAVDAVLSERGYDLALAMSTLADLTQWVERDDWASLLDTYARCVRITRGEERTYPVSRELMTESATVSLYDAYLVAAKRVASGQDVDAFLGAVVELAPHIRHFFDDVLVMDKDMSARGNRLGLLQAIAGLGDGIVDLTVLEGF